MAEFNRRDLLKYFGIGATIVPVLGGAPLLEQPAKLIAEPRLAPIETAAWPTPQSPMSEQLFRCADLKEPFGIRVDVLVGPGEHYVWNAEGLVVSYTMGNYHTGHILGAAQIACVGKSSLRYTVPDLFDSRRQEDDRMLAFDFSGLRPRTARSPDWPL